MLADPQTVTVDSVPISCARISSESTKSVYASADGNFKLTISHQPGKGRVRRMIRIDKTIVAADPLNSENEFKTAGIYLVVDEPTYGFTDDEIDDVIQGFKAWLTTGNVTAVLTSQH